nr:F-box protein family, AtFBX8 [Arabidopsis thaliana]
MGFSFLLATVQKERMKRRSRTRSRSRRRAKQDPKTWVARYIPQDLLIEILTRLPPKSVMRFKCVSKFWSSLLSSRYFCNRFLIVPSQPQPSLYMCLLDRYNYSKSLILSSAPSTSPYSFVFDQDLTIRKMGGFFLRILRGFIFFTRNLKARIYNPTTRQLVILPTIKESDIIAGPPYNILYFICHDPVNDRYKLLCTVSYASDNDLQNLKSELWIFVLEAGGSWKRVANEFPHHVPSHLDLNMNGVLYFLAWTDPHTCMLVSFDYGENVAVLDFTDLRVNGKMDLWVVEDAKKKEWSRKTFVLQPSQMHLDVTDNIWAAKGTSIKGKVILVPKKLFSSPFYFLYYDLQINDLKKVEVKGIPDRWFSNPVRTRYMDMELMDPSESIMYLET